MAAGAEGAVYTPTFIISQNPTRFGGKPEEAASRQEAFVRRSAEIIDSMAERIVTACETQADLKALFFELIDDASACRRDIAIEQGSERWREFGCRRNAHAPSHLHCQTLVNEYERYNRKTLKFIADMLKQMEISPGSFKQEAQFSSSYNGRLSRVDVKVLNPTQMMKCISIDPDKLPAFLKSESTYDPTKEWDSSQIAEYREKFRQFKETAPDAYQAYYMEAAVMDLNKTFPAPANLGIRPEDVRKQFSEEKAQILFSNMKSLFVHVTFRLQVEGKMYAMTKYLTWMYENKDWMEKKDPAHHPIQRMLDRSHICLAHQDEFLMAKTLEECATLFQQVLQWQRDTQTIEQLKDNMGSFLQLATHNIRDLRGTAAANEWLEVAMYKALAKLQGISFALTNRDQQMVDLEAFANLSSSDFGAAYRDLVEISFA